MEPSSPRRGGRTGGERFVPGSRGRLAVVAATALGVLVTLGCVPTAAVIQFPHPDPAPAAGHEVSMVGLGGTSMFTAGYAGGGLSWASRIGRSGGLSLGGWGGVSDGSGEGHFYGGAVEGAIGVGEPQLLRNDSGGEPVQGAHWVYITFGGRVHALFESVEIVCLHMCPTPPNRRWERLVAPQVSIGVAMRPMGGNGRGLFTAARLSGGPAFDLDAADPTEVYGPVLGIAAETGYRFAITDWLLLSFASGVHFTKIPMQHVFGWQVTIVLSWDFGPGRYPPEPTERAVSPPAPASTL